MSVPRRPSAVFEVHFVGDDLYPEKIPLRALSDALSAVQRLVTHSDASDADGAEIDEEELEESAKEDTKKESLKLLEVKRGSAVYKVWGTSPIPTKRSLELVGKVLENPENIESDQDFMLSPIGKLSTVAKRLSCSILLREPSKKKELGLILARIEPSSYEAISKNLLIRGQTSLLGRVERVGGASALRCGLRILSHKRMLICRVKSPEIARVVGQYLYQDVEVFGTAEWLKNSWRIFTFDIHDVVRQPDQSSIVDALEALREAGGKAWDQIPDPRAYLGGLEYES